MNTPHLYNVEAERALLGSLLIDPSAWRAVRATVAPGDFFREQHQWIFRALDALHRRREDVDMVTLSDELERAGRLAEAGGLAGLSDILGSVPTALHVESYAETVRNYARRRGLVAIAEKIARAAYETDAAADAERAARNMVSGLTSLGAGRHFTPLHEATAGLVEQLERMQAGDVAPAIPFPLAGLQDILGGMHPSEQTVLAARPSVGKTSLGVEIALHAALDEGCSVAYFSLEMGSRAMAARAVARRAGVTLSTMRRGPVEDYDLRRALEAHETFADARFHLDTTPALSAADIEARAEALHHREGGVDLIVIDYLQLMKDDERHRGDSARRLSVGANALRTRELARELGCHVLLISQLSRAGVDRPALNHLRDSGAIEEVADNVILLHAPGAADPSRDAAEREIIVAKGRNDGTGKADARLDGATGEWRDADALPSPRSNGRAPAATPHYNEEEYRDAF